MNNSSFRVIWGAALALAASVSSASAVPVLSFYVVQDRGAPQPAIPFTLLDLGTNGTPDTFVSNANGSAGGIAYTFGGSAGIYAGGVPNEAASPYGDLNHNTNYFSAGGNGGQVTLTYGAAQTSLSMVWGTLDPEDLRNVLITAGGNTFNGSDINELCNNCITNFGNQELYLTISGLNPFTEVTFRDQTSNAFEFNVAAVPELSTWGMMTLGFAGLGLIAYRRNSGAALRVV